LYYLRTKSIFLKQTELLQMENEANLAIETLLY